MSINDDNNKKLGDWMTIIDQLEQAYKIATYIDGGIAKEILLLKNSAVERAATVSYAIQRTQWVSK